MTFKESKFSVRSNHLATLLSGFILVVFSCSSLAELSLSQDLQESPLSASLNQSLQYRVGAQEHQVVVTQYGILNKATVTQGNNYSNNEANIVQLGNNNIVELFQYGSENIVNLSQYGNENYTEVLQQGNNNTANISQAGQQSFKVQQIGNGLEVNVTFYQR